MFSVIVGEGGEEELKAKLHRDSLLDASFKQFKRRRKTRLQINKLALGQLQEQSNNCVALQTCLVITPMDEAMLPHLNLMIK